MSGLPSAPFTLVRISAHQEPSLNQSLLCGLSSVGAVPVTLGKAGPWYMLGVAAAAAGACTTCSVSRAARHATNAAAPLRYAANSDAWAWLMCKPPWVVSARPYGNAAL